MKTEIVAVTLVFLSGCQTAQTPRDYTFSAIGIGTPPPRVNPVGNLVEVPDPSPQLIYFEQQSSNEGCFLKITEDEASDFINAMTMNQELIGKDVRLGLEEAGYLAIEAPNGDVAGVFEAGFKDFTGNLFKSTSEEADKAIHALARRYDCEWR